MKLPNKLYLSETDYIDFKNAQIVIDGKPPQTLKEFELYLLELFVTNINALVKYEIIEKHMEDIKNRLRKGGKSGNDFVFTRESLRNIIGNIRDYGESIHNCVVNERALGYKFVLSQELIDKSEFPESVTDIFNNNNTVEVDENFVFDSESDNDEENVTKLTLLKKLKSKKFLYVCIPVILAIAILSGAIFGINFTSFKASQDVYHITVNKPKAFNDEDREILEQRVKIFANGEKYSIDFNENKIEMYLPVSSFNDNEIEYVLDAYIIRATKLYAINSKEQNLKDAVFINRDDIESVNVLNGPINGVDASEYGIGVSDYKYFSIILKDEFITKNSEALKKLGENLAFAQDLDNDGWYYYYTFPQDDGKTFYVLNNDLSNNFINLLEFNLTHNSLSVDLSDYIVDINSKASWQSIKEVKNAGINQCDFNDFSDGTITFSLSAYGNLSDGEKVDTENALKQRLDVLGNPYAIGTYSTDDESFFVIKTTMDNISLPVIELISLNYSCSLKSGLSEYSLRMNPVVSSTDSNGYKISFVPSYYDDYEKEELIEFTKSISESEQIYMYVDSMPLLGTNIDGIDINTGTISFTEICQIRSGKIINESIDAEYSYLLDIFNAISETSDNMESLSFEAYQFNVNKHGNLPTEKDFNLTYDYYDDEIASQIMSICPSAKIVMKDLNLYVSLKLPVDDNLVSSSLEYSKDIYNAVDFENSILEGINIYFIDEDNSVMERGRIFFNKNYKTSYSEGYISTHGIFTNGRLEKYKDEFKEAVDNNNFISSFHQDEYAWAYSM